MKRLTLCLLFAVTLCLTINAQSVGLYINTHGDGYTNVRNSPSGQKVATLGDGDMIVLNLCQNGWFRISDRNYTDGDGEERKLPSGTALWVHSSQLTADWIGDGGVTVVLRSEAGNKGSVIYKGKGVSDSCRIKAILDMKGSYLKVRLKNGKTGWVPTNIICGNSLTTCC